jgi:uncharacterized damage-inducible protein DinB
MKHHWVVVMALACCSAMPIYAQDAAPSVSAGIKGGYNNIKNNIMKAADKMPDDGYAFSPTKEERSFGAWVGHVADVQTLICSRAAGSPKMGTAAKLTSKADLMAALKQSFDGCDAVYATLTDTNLAQSVQGFRGPQALVVALAGNVAHDNECYGSMAVYLRLKGVVPPSSEAEAARPK